MAKQVFLDNFRTARNLFMHPHVEMVGAQGDARQMEQLIARAAIWLTPKSVKGFNSDDFLDLRSDRREELQRAIAEFLAVAGEVPPTEAATREQLTRGSAAMAKALAILEPYLWESQERAAIEKILATIQFPAWVDNWAFELGADQDGEPVVWINLYVGDSAAAWRNFGRVSAQLTIDIQKRFTESGILRWPHVGMRTSVEHKSA